MPRLVLTTIAAAVLALALPALAHAHGFTGRADLPLPEVAFVVAAAAVLVISFGGLALLWQQPRLEEPVEHPITRLPLAFDVSFGALGFAIFALVICAGLAGVQDVNANITPTAIFVVFWVGIPFVSILFGDVWRALSPWRNAGRLCGWALQRLLPRGLPQAPAYPEQLGYWPAVVGIVAFGWIELVWPNRGNPESLALAGLLYFFVMCVGQAMYGVEAWGRRADAFGVYFGLFGRLSWLRRDVDGTLYRRRPLSGIGVPLEGPATPGVAALVIVAIGVTAFDGFKEGRVFLDVVPDVQRFFVDSVGLSLKDALTVTYTLGLVAIVLAIGALFLTGLAGLGALRRGPIRPQALFAHTLIPIAAAYVVAHYFSLFVFQGQALIYLASDPLGEGSDLFGTATTQIDYDLVSPNGVWYVQCIALVLGHVCGLMLAHDRALAATKGTGEAVRTQVVMLFVTVCFTVLGLWLLSAAN